MFTWLYDIAKRSISLPTTSIEERLRLAQIAISNALADPTLLAALAEYGFTPQRLQQGRTLHQQAWDHYQSQKDKYSDVSSAHKRLEAAQEQAHATYMRYVKKARLEFEHDHDASQKLGLMATRKYSLSKWMAQARHFYTQALSSADILDRLADAGVTRAMLEAGLLQLNAVEESDAVVRRRRGAARNSTRVRDEAITALNDWMRRFTNVARTAFDDQPQLLEQLGMKTIVRRSTARAARSAAQSQVAPAAESPIPSDPDSDQPAAYSGNGMAPVGSA